MALFVVNCIFRTYKTQTCLKSDGLLDMLLLAKVRSKTPWCRVLPLASVNMSHNSEMRAGVSLNLIASPNLTTDRHFYDSIRFPALTVVVYALSCMMIPLTWEWEMEKNELSAERRRR